jgi:hypothetical protein
MKNTKICNVCNSIKELDDFHKRKNGLHGRFAICKVCRRQYASEYYLNNTEEINTKSKLWRQDNQKKRKEIGFNYREKNKEKLKISSKKYRNENKDKEKKIL